FPTTALLAGPRAVKHLYQLPINDFRTNYTPEKEIPTPMNMRTEQIEARFRMDLTVPPATLSLQLHANNSSSHGLPEKD
ncbi:hypothetical protein BaRGS_00036063, partial [Batillaria attramentaria]